MGWEDIVVKWSIGSSEDKVRVWPKNREIPLPYYCLFLLVEKSYSESDALNVGTEVDF